MIHTGSILPALAGLIGLALAIVAVSILRPTQFGRKQLLFTLLCFSSGLWALSVATHLNVTPQGFPTLSRGPAALFALEVLMTVSVMSSAVFWYLFSSEHTRRFRPVRGAPLVATLALIPASALGALTNPLHHLFFSLNAAGVRTYGPIGTAQAAIVLVSLATGTVYFALYARQRQTLVERRRAWLVSAASSAVLLGGLLWATRSLTGLELSTNPSPSLLVGLVAVLATQALRHGMADVLPQATSSAVLEMNDGVIYLDEDLRVVSANPAAREFLPGLSAGARIKNVAADIARHARYCLGFSADNLTFELAHDSRVFWGRLRRVYDDGRLTGCLVILTDLTELRDLQGMLLQNGKAPDGGAPSDEYLERLSRQGGRLS